MKTKNLFLILILTASFFAATACSQKQAKGDHVAYYTCSMHPQIHEDQPGDCPICQMKLTPVYREEAAKPEDQNGPKADAAARESSAPLSH